MTKLPKVLILLPLLIVGCAKESPKKTVNSSPAIALELTPDPEPVVAGFCSKVNTVRTVDITGVAVPVAFEQIIRLTSSSTEIKFYSDSDCKSAISAVKLAEGESQAQFYFKPSKSEYLTISTSTQNLSADVESKTIVSPFASEIRLSGIDSVKAGECSSPLTVTAYNYKNEISQTDSDLKIVLSGNGTGKFYLDPSCEGTTVSETKILNGESEAKVYFKANRAGAYNFTATAPGPLVSKLSLVLSPNTPTRFVFITAPQYIEAGNCSSITTVRVQDNYGNAVKLPSDTNVNLNSISAKFYKNEGCSGESVVNLTIPAGSETFSFYTHSTSVGESDLEVSSFANQRQTLTVNASKPVKLSLANVPTSVIAGTSLGKIDITIEDKYGNKSADTSQLVSLYSYSDPECKTLTSKTLNGFSQVTSSGGKASFLSLSYDKAETIYLGARAGSLTSACSHPVKIKADFPSRIILEGPSSIVAGACVEYTLYSADRFKNVAPIEKFINISVSGEKSGKFYLSPSCQGTTTSVYPMGLNSSSRKIYYMNNKVEQLEFSLFGLGSSTLKHPISMIAGAPSQIAVFGQTKVEAGACVQGFQLKVQDILGNDSSVPEDSFVSYNFNGSKGEFYTDATCVSKLNNPFKVDKSSSQRSFYFRNTKAEDVVVNFTGLQSSGTTLSISINSAAPVKVQVESPSRLKVGDPLTELIAKAVDVYGNTATTYSSPISISFHSDDKCTSDSRPGFIGPSVSQSEKGVSGFGSSKFTRAENVFILAKGDKVSEGCSSAVEFTSNIPTKTKIFTAERMEAGACIEASVSYIDDYSNKVKSIGDTSFDLYSESGGEFFESSSCSNQKVTSVTVRDGEYEARLYYKTTKSGSSFIYANSPGYTTTKTEIKVSPLSPHKVAFGGAKAVDADSCSEELLVMSQDKYSNPTPVPVEVSASLAQSGFGSFYSDPECSSEASSIRIPPDSTSAKIYFKSTKAEDLRLSAAAAGFISEEYFFTVGALPPSGLIASGPVSLFSGVCSGPVAVSTIDIFDNLSKAREPLTISPSSFGEGKFFMESDCSGTELTSFVLSKDNHTVNLYYKNNKAEELDIIFSAIEQNALYHASVYAGPAAKAEVISEPKTILAGTCSGAIVIQAKDINGNKTIALSDITVELLGDNVSYFSTSSCSGSKITEETIPAAAESVTVYASSTKSSAKTLKIKAFGVETTQPFTVTPDSPVKVGFVSIPTQGMAGPISFGEPIVASIQDRYGNTVEISESNESENSADIFIAINPFSDSQCLTSAGSVFAGENSKKISLGIASFSPIGYNTSDTIYVSVTSQGLASTCSPAVAINPQSPVKITISGPPSSTAGVCNGPYYAHSKDPFNNSSAVASDLLVAFSSIGESSSIHSDSSCSGPVSNKSISIPKGSHTVPFYYKVTEANSYIFSAASNLGLATYPVSVKANVPTKVVISGPLDVFAGKCSAVYTLKTEDSWNNRSEVTEDKTFTLDGKKTGAFYSDFTCQTVVSSVSIPTGKSSAQFYYKNPSLGETTVLSSVLPGFTSVGASVRVVTPPPTNLSISGASVIIAGQCSQYVIAVRDMYNDLASSDGHTSVSLSGNGTGFYYSDSSCLSQISATLISDRASSISVWYKSDQTQNITLSASSTGLTSASKPVAVTFGSPASIKFTTQPSISAKAGDILAQSLRAEFNDIIGNRVFVDDGSKITVSLHNLDGTAATGLKGNLSVAPDRNTGIASFSDLNIETTGQFKIKITGKTFSEMSDTITVSHASPYLLKKESGDNQSAFVETTYTNPLVVSLVDRFGNVIPNFDISWSANGSGTFTPATGSTDSSGRSSVQFKSSSSAAGAVSLKATVTSAPTVTTTFTGYVSNINKLALSGPTSVGRSVCSGPFTVQTYNPSNTLENAYFPLQIELVTGLSAVSFFTDSGCSVSAASSGSNFVTIATGTNSRQFYVRSTGTGGYTITAKSNLSAIQWDTKAVVLLYGGFSPTSHNYGTTNTYVDRTFQFQNLGSDTMPNVTFSYSNFTYFRVQADACSNKPLAPGAQCAITIRFRAGDDGVPNSVNSTASISFPATGTSASLYGNTSYVWSEVSNYYGDCAPSGSMTGSACGPKGSTTYWCEVTAYKEQMASCGAYTCIHGQVCR